MGSGFLKKKKQAKMFQEQMAGMQEAVAQKLDTMQITGSSGQGLVEVTLNGAYELQKIKIKPECVDPEDVDGLETLVKAAFQDAAEKVKQATESGSGMPDLSALGF